MRFGKNKTFFHSILNVNKNIIQKVKGISWDLFFTRRQEFMACNGYNGIIIIPFYISFDNKFHHLVNTCPISCIIIDDDFQYTQTLFKDEIDFCEDLYYAIPSNLKKEICNPISQIARMESKHTRIEDAIIKLENQIMNELK